MYCTLVKYATYYGRAASDRGTTSDGALRSAEAQSNSRRGENGRKWSGVGIGALGTNSIILNTPEYQLDRIAIRGVTRGKGPHRLPSGADTGDCYSIVLLEVRWGL